MQHARSYVKNYPRPQLSRKEWLNLNGEWNFKYKNIESKKLQNGFESDTKINVPFTYETKMSGIFDDKQYEEVWYSRKFNVSKEQLTDIVLLHFEGSDYITTVFVNGEYVGENKGAYHRFSFDIKKCLVEGENTITVKVQDDLFTDKPRGKQRWQDKNFACFYIQTTGVWKTVWLEFLNKTYLSNIKLTADFEKQSLAVKTKIANLQEDTSICFDFYYRDKLVYNKRFACEYDSGFFLANGACPNIECTFELKITDFKDKIRLWDIDNPNIYDIVITIQNGEKTVDISNSYFGFRNISITGNEVFLNEKPFYFKLVLDQGYYKDSGISTPSEQALINDISLTKQMGFNGVRKHQKVEDELYLYYADIMGLMVWCEMPSAYSYNENTMLSVSSEWQKIVTQNYNHPAILVWVCLNESWGVRGIIADKDKQDYSLALYYQTKALDNTRPVISNDGWQQTISDILTIHTYEQDPEKFYNAFKIKEEFVNYTNLECPWTTRYALGYKYEGQPIIMTEYGGISYQKDQKDGTFSYGSDCKNEEEFVERFEGLYQAIKKMPSFSGFCYTQLTDVEQELNGLLDIERNPKIDINRVRDIISK